MPKGRLKPRTEPSVEKMFEDRMLREGRWEEFEQAKIASNANTPPVEDKFERITRGKAIKAAAMQACGFVSRDHERALYRAWKDHSGRIETVRDKSVQSKTFDAAHKTLPIKADGQVENDWIMAHPALARKSRDPEKDVIITGDDLLNADHGPCPSRAAANKLQYWANNPQKVYENLAVVMKKSDGRDSTASADEVIDDGIEELERARRALGVA